MSDQIRARDPGAIWRGQPEEKLALKLEQILNRRAEALGSNTRSEILMSVSAALLFVGVMAWRFAPAPGRLQEVGFIAVIAWAVISLYRFRQQIWWRNSLRPDAMAAPVVEYYRQELEQRRDHLRNAWLWHGPLVLVCMILIAVLLGKAFPGFERLPSVLPLIVLLAVWTGFGLTRRRRQAKQLQREIDEFEPCGTKGRYEPR